MDKYFNEDGFRIMKEYMIRNNISHTSVKPIPFLNIFVPEDVSDYTDATYEKYFDKNVPTMSFGSYGLAKQLISEGYTPGGFINDNFNIKVQMKKWGAENFLNGDCIFSTTKKLCKEIDISSIGWNKIFIRPVHDTKAMIARVIEQCNFNYSIEQFNSCNEDIEVLISEAKDITSEYRLFIVDSKVIAYSLYKRYGKYLTSSEFIPTDILNKAEKLCSVWTPSEAFVMDFAESPTGVFKVLEVNNINCSGFYSCDIPSIVEAIIKLEDKL